MPLSNVIDSASVGGSEFLSVESFVIAVCAELGAVICARAPEKIPTNEPTAINKVIKILFKISPLKFLQYAMRIFHPTTPGWSLFSIYHPAPVSKIRRCAPSQVRAIHLCLVPL